MSPMPRSRLGSALAAFMYPHTLTGIFASNSGKTIRKNAIMLPAYTLLLGLLALLGYMGHAANLKLDSANDVVPTLFKTLFSGWFSGFAFAAIAIGALVPAAVMSIGAANLFTRNFWKAYVDPDVSDAGEAKVAKITSLVVKIGALLVIIFLPTQFALDLQLLGGIWILQTLPALVFGLYTNWFRAPALAAGWFVGFGGGTFLGLGCRLEASAPDQPRRRTVHRLYRVHCARGKYRRYSGVQRRCSGKDCRARLIRLGPIVCPPPRDKRGRGK